MIFYYCRNSVRGFYANQCGRLRSTDMHIETGNDRYDRDQTSAQQNHSKCGQ